MMKSSMGYLKLGPKEKGKGGRGRGGRGKEGGRGSANQHFEGYCHFCGMWGHNETDCWQNPKNQGGGGGANTNTITDGAQQ